MVAARSVKDAESVGAFLRRNTGESFCMACLQKKLRVEARSQVHDATKRLGLMQNFDRHYVTCSVCGKVRRVIRAL